ncbi:MAG: SUMF1/EgtB/PvdO family nonheme iron enzyme, partial [Bacteroidota bacterium]
SSEHPRLGGLLKPNAWGLYDMSGNVKEWCYDLYGEFYYLASEGINPKGDKNYATRVVRGGSWLDDAMDCRIKGREYMYPSQELMMLGFRLARSLPKVSEQK